MVDMETCSWCLEEVPDRTLVMMPDGARVCRECKRQSDESREQ